MDVLQSWLIVGIPAVVVMAALLAGRSRIRAMGAFVVLAATLVFFLTVPSDLISSALIGLIGVLLVATGRGTSTDEGPEEHQNRKRYTTDPSHA